MSLMPPSARTDAGKSQRVAELADALENVQAARPIAMQVLQLADDPDADARADPDPRHPAQWHTVPRGLRRGR